MAAVGLCVTGDALVSPLSFHFFTVPNIYLSKVLNGFAQS
jgi:hypothetical protein